MQGLAVIKSNLLVDYSLKLHKDKWGPQKRDRVLSSLASCIKDYDITTISLSRPYLFQQTRESKELYVNIRSLAYQQKLRLVEYMPNELLSICTGTEKRTKKILMANVSYMYPELSPYYEKEVGNKNKYYIKLFEAVAAATLFMRDVGEWKH
jgi:Holliday junction resolvasome RuvABC endonuclease subunit